MKHGSRCFRGSLAAVLTVCGISGFYWWWKQPRTPEALFKARCSSCHELRVQRLCEFEAALRPAMVQVMRRDHGADQAIDEREAVLIENYLRDRFVCP